MTEIAIMIVASAALNFDASTCIYVLT